MTVAEAPEMGPVGGTPPTLEPEVTEGIPPLGKLEPTDPAIEVGEDAGTEGTEAVCPTEIEPPGRVGALDPEDIGAETCEPDELDPEAPLP